MFYIFKTASSVGYKKVYRNDTGHFDDDPTHFHGKQIAWRPLVLSLLWLGSISIAFLIGCALAKGPVGTHHCQESDLAWGEFQVSLAKGQPLVELTMIS